MAEHRGPFTVNREEVVSKVIDGELIIIRLSDGTYYSMENVGTRVWELVERHHDLPAVVETIAAWYGTPAARVESDVAALVRDLVQERLIAVSAEGAAPGARREAAPTGLLAYEPPRLNVYRDMGNLLALDPPTPGIDDIPLKEGKNR